MLPVDWAALLLLGLPLTCLCLYAAPQFVPVWPTIAVVTGVGTAYIVGRIFHQPRVPLHVRLQLTAAALIAIASAIGACVMYFHPFYSWWYRAYAPARYGWFAALAVGLIWFAIVKVIVLRRERKGE
jgi:hypothetical protein